MSIVAIASPAPLMMQPMSPLKPDVVESMLAGLGLAGILLRRVSHLGDRRTPKQRVVVERHLGVQRQQSVVLGDDQRLISTIVASRSRKAR